MISAIILAAGASKRMGQQKLLMKWGEMTVIERVISVFSKYELEQIVVVTGADRIKIEGLVLKTHENVKTIFNPDHENGGMLSSIQCGIRGLAESNSSAVLVGLGDQPQIEERTVRLVCEAYLESRHPILLPSFNMRRGHPWLLDRSLWNEFLDSDPLQTAREFLNAHSNLIRHVDAGTPTILADLDTPDDYQSAQRGKFV